jgi:hypothetical protein
MKGLLDQINQLMKTSEMLVLLYVRVIFPQSPYLPLLLLLLCIEKNPSIHTQKKQQAQLNEYFMK